MRFIAIGFDTRFVQPFVEGQFWKGELYVDSEKEAYNALQLPTFSWWDLAKYVISAKWRTKYSEIKERGLTNDMKGDGFQNGGAMIVDKGGKLLYEYRQEDASEQISSEEIFKALNINQNAE